MTKYTYFKGIEKDLHQVKFADKVLDAVQLIDPRAIIAGGAPRDWVLGKHQCKDLDVYIYKPEHLYIFEVVDNLIKLGFSISERGTSSKEAYDSIPELQSVINCKFREHWLPVQIIMLNRPMGPNPEASPNEADILGRFNCSLSKVFYKENVLYTTPEFDVCVKSKINYIKAGSEKAPNISSVKGKYPEYGHVVGSLEYTKECMNL